MADSYNVVAAAPAKKTNGRQKIPMKKIENKERRQVTFSKRKKGLINKAAEFNILTGAHIEVKVVSETGKMFEFSSQSNAVEFVQEYAAALKELEAVESLQRRNEGAAVAEELWEKEIDSGASSEELDCYYNTLKGLKALVENMVDLKAQEENRAHLKAQAEIQVNQIHSQNLQCSNNPLMDDNLPSICNIQYKDYSMEWV